MQCILQKKLETSKKFYDIHEINLEKLKKLSPTGFLINWVSNNMKIRKDNQVPLLC